MENLLIKVCNMGIAAGWLILAVLLLRLLLKQMPKSMRCILWGFVGIRLSCPWSVETVLSLIPSAQTISPNIVYQMKPTIHSGILELNQVVNPILSESFAATEFQSANPLQIWIFGASIVWIAGFVLIMAYAAISLFRLNRRVRESVRWKENLYLCDRIDTPFVLGLVHPRIILPSAMEEEQSMYVIAHEKAHLERYDYVWKLFGFVLLAVYWFHPLCWVAYWMFCSDLELACDERAIRGYDLNSRKAYATALLECSVNHSNRAAYPLGFGEINVKERVKNVLNQKKPAFWMVLVSSLACILAAMCFLTNPRPETEVFGYRYSVEEIVYDAPQYSYMFGPDTKLVYELAKDATLTETGSSSSEIAFSPWGVRGTAVRIKLTYENFDQYVENMIGINLIQDISASLRQENKKAWYVASSEEENKIFYYILLQKNGDIYLTYGYERGIGMEEDNSNIRWIFKLSKGDRL